MMSCVSQEVKDLYHLLENEFFPLDLASKVQPLLAKISKVGGKLISASSLPDVHLSQYVPALEKLCTLRVLQQVYIHIPRPFMNSFWFSKRILITLLISMLSFPSSGFSSVSINEIEMLSMMIPFFDFSVVEKISVDAVKYNFIAMRIDHLKGTVHFGTMVCECHLSSTSSSLYIFF